MFPHSSTRDETLPINLLRIQGGNIKSPQAAGKMNAHDRASFDVTSATGARRSIEPSTGN
jgi:hypothetical protein